MRVLVLISILLISSFTASAGTYIVQNAEITSVANTNSNTESFAIWVEGGSGVCANSLITFPLSAVESTYIHNRAYSMALSALATGMKVTVYDYAGASCSNAGYIRILRKD